MSLYGTPRLSEGDWVAMRRYYRGRRDMVFGRIAHICSRHRAGNWSACILHPHSGQDGDNIFPPSALVPIRYYAREAIMCMLTHDDPQMRRAGMRLASELSA